MPAKSSKPKGKRGGARPGAGRKPKASTVLRDQLRVTKADDAEYAYNLFVEKMKSRVEETEVRLDAAREVMNRVWGKPRQAVDLDVKGETVHSLADEDRKLIDGLTQKLGATPEAKAAAAEALLHAAEEIERGNPG